MVGGTHDLARRVAPAFPADYRPGVAIVGCGAIVRQAHLPAYEKYGVRVAGVYDLNPDAVSVAAQDHDLGRIFGSLDELLADPEIEVVDVATHPAARVPVVRQALEAGKHVLAQKPFAPDIGSARDLVGLAEQRGLALAVNQNGRWAPAWRLATLLVEAGSIGEPLAVTHLLDEHNQWLLSSPYDEVENYVIYDGAIHWIDISRCWLDGKQPAAVRARAYRPPGQPVEARQPWAALVDVVYADGSSTVLRAVGQTSTDTPRFPFWIHGTEGIVSGGTLDTAVALERGGETTEYRAAGNWFPDGFGGTMGELLTAVAQGREPYNSARHNLASLEITLAACRSAERDGATVELPLEGGG